MQFLAERLTEKVTIRLAPDALAICQNSIDEKLCHRHTPAVLQHLCNGAVIGITEIQSNQVVLCLGHFCLFHQTITPRPFSVPRAIAS